jgi:hypothetical protein
MAISICSNSWCIVVQLNAKEQPGPSFEYSDIVFRSQIPHPETEDAEKNIHEAMDFMSQTHLPNNFACGMWHVACGMRNEE